MVLSSQLRSTMIGSQPFEMVFPWFPVPASPDFPDFPDFPNPPIRLFGHKRWHIGTLSRLAGQNSWCISTCTQHHVKMMVLNGFLAFLRYKHLALSVVPHFPYTAYPLSKAPVAVSSYRAKVVPDQGQLQKQANADGFKMDPIHNSLTNVVSFFDLLKCIILANHWFQRKLISYFKSTPHTNTLSSDGSMLVV